MLEAYRVASTPEFLPVSDMPVLEVNVLEVNTATSSTLHIRTSEIRPLPELNMAVPRHVLLQHLAGTLIQSVLQLSYLGNWAVEGYETCSRVHQWQLGRDGIWTPKVLCDSPASCLCDHAYGQVHVHARNWCSSPQHHAYTHSHTYAHSRD